MTTKRKPIRSVTNAVKKSVRRFIFPQWVDEAAKEIVESIEPFLRTYKPKSGKKAKHSSAMMKLLSAARKKDHFQFCTEFAKFRKMEMNATQKRQFSKVLKKCMELLA